MPLLEAAPGADIDEYDHTISATAAAVNIFNAIKKTGKAYNLGQGREQQEPPLQIRMAYAIASLLYVGKSMKDIATRKLSRAEAIAGLAETSTEYNAKHGGDDEVKTVAAGWMKRFFGLEGNASNTFVFQQLGRAVLEKAASTIRTMQCIPDENGMVVQPLVFIPATCWPMLSQSFIDFKHEEYQVNDAPQDENILNALREDKSGRPVLLYLNFPHNPTGRIMSEEELQRLVEGVKELNRERAASGLPPITLLFDTPYFHANPENEEKGKSFLKMGYEVLKRAGDVPYFVVASGSKAFGTAKPGLTFASMHDMFVKPFGAAITASIGGAYSPRFFEGVKKAFSEKYDATWLKHFRSMREKYVQNFRYLAGLVSEKLTGFAPCEGNPGMTSLWELDTTKYFNKIVTGAKGTWLIQNVKDFVEYLANEHNTVVVDNSTPAGAFVRVAQAAVANDNGFNGGARNLVAGCVVLEKAPVYKAV